MSNKNTCLFFISIYFMPCFKFSYLYDVRIFVYNEYYWKQVGVECIIMILCDKYYRIYPIILIYIFIYVL